MSGSTRTQDKRSFREDVDGELGMTGDLGEPAAPVRGHKPTPIHLPAPSIVFLAGLVFWLFVASIAEAAPGCPANEGDFPKFYQDAGLFTEAIAKVGSFEPSNQKPTGVTVPHHLIAGHLVALGFRAASGFSYKRVIILAPDHFRKTLKPFATTRRGFDTVFGTVRADKDAVGSLLAGDDLVEESCLFDKDHGVRAMLPFLQHYFPDARIVPLAISIKAKRADWDRMAEALAPLVDRETLIVESTDFSHYLPQHEARRFDQQTLNLIAAGSLDQLAGLRQPDHLDSLGALYIQMKLQQKIFGARPLVIANENSQQYDTRPAQETTSYNVILFGAFDAAHNNPSPDTVKVYYLAGDTNFGRDMKRALLEDGAAERISGEVLARTRSRPLVLNLEGVILPNVPEAIDDMTLAMPEELALEWLRKLNVAGVGLANNHAMDLGQSGYVETTRALKAAGMAWFGQGEVLELPGIDIVGVSDLDTNASRQTDLLTPELLDRLIRPEGEKPVVAFVHWGREYRAEPSQRETMLADAMRLRSVTAIVGAHPHVASKDVAALGGGDVGQVYSLGNFLFDQGAARSSGQLVELRVFEQGTVFMRTIALPNLFDLAKKQAGVQAGQQPL